MNESEPLAGKLTTALARWNADCQRQWGKFLDGRLSHYCPDWNYLPIDESCKEYISCTCFTEEIDMPGSDEDIKPLDTLTTLETVSLLGRDRTDLLILDGAITKMTKLTHQLNSRWWRDLETDQPITRNVGELLMLVVSELAEGMEGHRKNLPDDKLPHRPMLEVELADAVIRIFDLAGGLDLDLGGAWREKMEYNMTREDHSREARLSKGGKKY